MPRSLLWPFRPLSILPGPS